MRSAEEIMLRSLTLVDTTGLPCYNASNLKLSWLTSYIVTIHFAQLYDHRRAYDLDCSTAPKQPGRQAKTAVSRADEIWAPYAAELTGKCLLAEPICGPRMV